MNEFNGQLRLYLCEKKNANKSQLAVKLVWLIQEA